MADRVPPIVRLLLPADSAVCDLADGVWTLRNPRTVYQLPPDGRFPFQAAHPLWVYAQLVDGLGAFDLGVEMLQVRDDGSRRVVGSSPTSTRVEFRTDNQLIPVETAFELRRVRFREAGVYEFRAVLVTPDRVEALSGAPAVIRVLDRRGTV